MPWRLKTVTVGWLPHMTLEHTDKAEKAPLHELFVFLEGRHVLCDGYGKSAGITSLDDLAVRVDAIRDRLFAALTKLPPEAPIADWLRKLEEASHELLEQIYTAMNARGEPAPEPSDIGPAVDQLREAFAEVAAHVSALYGLPAAGNLADQIRKDLAPRPTGNG